MPDIAEDVLGATAQFPVAVLKERAVAHNVATMAAYCVAYDALLAPHAKTTMAPALCERQLAAGAWGMTVATWAQAAVLWDAGVRRLIFANPLVGDGEIAWVAERANAGELLSFADDVETVRALSRRVPAGADLPVLVEIGYAGGRAGCRTTAQAVAVAHAIVEAPGLRLVGVAGFEGLLAACDDSESVARVSAYLRAIADAARALPVAPLISAGGSAFFDLVVDQLGPVARELGGQLVLRSGCYITHDHGLYARIGPSGRRAPMAAFAPALEVWGQVLSRPEEGRVIVGVGKRNVAFDTDPPEVVAWRRGDGDVRPGSHARTVALNDQHAHLEVDHSCPLRPGDLVGFGISHPCAAFDRWRSLVLVDDAYLRLGEIATWF
jgi:D-serine deaminase-like pyridoxal phosphate-dependent protein